MEQQESLFKHKVIEKTLTLPNHKDTILNSMTQAREKWDSNFWVEQTLEWYKGVMVFFVFIVFIYLFIYLFIYFCLEPTVWKNTWMRTTSAIVMVIFSKLLLWKLLDHSYVQSSFWTTLRPIDNGIWETLYS